MENPFNRTKDHGDDPYLSPVDIAAVALRASGERAPIVDLGSSSAGINLNLNDEARAEMREQLVGALKQLGFK